MKLNNLRKVGLPASFGGSPGCFLGLPRLWFCAQEQQAGLCAPKVRSGGRTHFCFSRQTGVFNLTLTSQFASGVRSSSGDWGEGMGLP